MRGGGGQTPRRTSSSEKWEDADKPTKEKETGGQRRPQGRESGSRDRERRVSFVTGGQGVGDYTGPLHFLWEGHRALYQPCHWEWQSRAGEGEGRTK